MIHIEKCKEKDAIKFEMNSDLSTFEEEITALMLTVINSKELSIVFEKVLRDIALDNVEGYMVSTDEEESVQPLNKLPS